MKGGEGGIQSALWAPLLLQLTLKAESKIPPGTIHQGSLELVAGGQYLPITFHGPSVLVHSYSDFRSKASEAQRG